MWSAEQAAGTAQFVDDITPQRDELRAVLIQSDRAHARDGRMEKERTERYTNILRYSSIFSALWYFSSN